MPLLRGSIVPLAAELQEQLTADGWQLGCPDAYPVRARQIDVQTAGRMKCPGCRRRQLLPCFYHRDGRVRVLACCPHEDCGAAEEV